MSTLPWGTMNDWLRSDVEERAATIQHRRVARARQAAQRTQAAPVGRPAEPGPTTRPAVSQAVCTEAA